MKKTLLLLTSAALLLVGCAKEQAGPGAAGEGDMVEVDITTGTAERTKAVIDEDGAAANVTRWIMEVRDASGAVYAYKVGTEEAGTLQHTFNIKLFKNQQYTFAFWADNGGEFYDASDLSAIKYADGKSVVAGVDAKDAFSAVETLTLTESITKTITLYRPFAQLNVITNDLAALKADAISAEAYNAFKPKNFKTTITVPTQFNVLTGAASEETELILSADEFYGKDPLSYEKAPEQATMFMAYIFATKDEKDIRNINFKFDVDSQTGNNTFDFTDVPFQRNYRTNILGNFLSGDAEWTVIIDPDWDGEYDFPPYEAGSIAAANVALAAGETNISISNPSDFDENSLVIPAAVNDKDLIIAVAEKADMELDIDASNSTPKTISLSAVKAKSLNIDAPATHVELTAGEYKTVDAATSATTLVVGKNTKITEKLTIHEGNAVIDGTVKTFVNETGATLVWNVANTAELANAVKFAGVADEIKLAAGNYTMPDKVETSGLKISGEGGAVIDCPATCTISANDVVLKDLTVKCNPSNGSTSGTWAVSKNATLENCVFTENSKYIVNVSGTGTVDFKGCRFENAGKGRGIMVWGGTPVINVDECYFDNVYPFNVDGGSPVFTVKNSHLNGWTSYTNTATASFENCDFGKSTSGYAYLRPYSSTELTNCNFCKDALVSFGADGIAIEMNGCKHDGQPVTGKILDPDGLEKCPNCKLIVDGTAIYPFTSFEVSSVAELKQAVKVFNASKQAAEHTIIVNDGTYEASDMVLWQNLEGKSLVIAAKNPGSAVIKPNSNTKSHRVFLVAGGSSYDATRKITLEGLTFDFTQAPDVESAPVYFCQSEDSYVAAIEGSTSSATRYAHDVILKKCTLNVFEDQTENVQFVICPANASGKRLVLQDCNMTNGGYFHSGYVEGIVCENCSLTGAKAMLNSQSTSKEEPIIVTGCNISTRHDYCIRTSGGDITVTDNVFNMSWADEKSDAAVVYLRNTVSAATLSGNTFNKAGAAMFDVYCKSAWSVNGVTQTPGTGINF